MSTIHETTASVQHALPNATNFRNWMARRRIAISITCFTALIVFNLTVLGTQPTSPLNFWVWNSGLGLSLIVAGLAIRSWSAGTLHKHSQLTTVGPYAVVRNPLYLGSFLMMYGFAFIMSDWLSVLFIAIPMSMLYYFQVMHEEKHLARTFSAKWVEYCRRTPRFIPCKYNSHWLNGWSFSQWLRNREYQAILGAGLGVLGLIALSAFN